MTQSYSSATLVAFVDWTSQQGDTFYMLQPVDAICSACKILLTFFFKKWGEGNNLELYHIDDFHLQNNVFLIPLTFWLRICPILKMHGMCVMDIVNKIRLFEKVNHYLQLIFSFPFFEYEYALNWRWYVCNRHL